jgi:HK97 family phage major capsid protein
VLLASLDLQPTKSGAYFGVHNEWLQDADLGIQAKLEQIFITSLRWFIEKRLWTGTGGAQPIGALVGPGTLEIPKEAGQAVDSIVSQDVLKMWARLRPGSHSRAMWVCNQTCFPQLAALTITSGTSGAPIGLVQPGSPRRRCGQSDVGTAAILQRTFAGAGR